MITKIYYPETNKEVWFYNGRRFKIMDKQFNTIWREGKKLDMFMAIEELQAKYKHDLQASVDSYDTYEGVSDTTYNDFEAVKGTIEMFQMLGYLYRDEADDMIQVAREQRKTVLEALEGVKE